MGSVRAEMKRIFRTSVNWIPFSLRGYIRRVPGVAALQRALVARLLGGRSFVHTINAGPAAGLEFEVTLPRDKSIWTGTHEAAFAAAIAESVRPGDICYDIGGYLGFMAGVLALGGALEVIVFEPLPRNQLALRRLCDLNPQLPIRIKPFAVGRHDGSLTLQVMPDDSMGRLSTSSLVSSDSSIGELVVGVRTIDDLVESGEIRPPDVIKIDVEGAELEVLRGGARTLEMQRPLVFLEAHSRSLEDACVQELESHDYSARRIGIAPESDERARHLEARPRSLSGANEADS